MADLPIKSPDRLPTHIAIIMDGNGRWARQRNLQRIEGHKQGATSVRRIVTECSRINHLHGNPKFLTLYSFSTENWKRPQDEVDFLMGMYVQYLHSELPTMLQNNVRFHQVGRDQGMSPEAIQCRDHAIRATAANTGLTVNLAVNYGSRAEIVDAVRAIARQVAAGTVAPDAIDENLISRHLYTAGLPDPDLLIRTAGEMRLSNFLLWQISYAELHITDVLWPDYDVAHLHSALDSYASRRRRFGSL
jgi:undecaprenyl diphosphate synthase